MISIPEKCTSKSYIKIKCHIHNFIYNVSIVSFINNKSKCPKCQKNFKYSKNEYLLRIKEKISSDYLPYTFVSFVGEFKNAHSKICLHCDKCNRDWQLTINAFLSSGKGCPVCNKSKGETFIRKLLVDNNIDFVQEKKFDTCRDKLPLPFDFYIPKYNLLIEYDGQQHFVGGWFGNISNLQKVQDHDNIKTEWARKNNLHLIRYNYRQSFDIIKKDLLGLLYSYESKKN